MQQRLLATAVTVLALAAPLSSCGFDYATDRVNAVSNGATNRDGDVDVLSAVVVSAAQGSGTFVASFSNNDPDAEQTFTAVAGADGQEITSADFDPVTIKPGGLVNLADPAAGIVLSGDFTAGDNVPLTVDFGNGERVSLNVPVVSDETGYWEGLDAS